MAYAKLYRFLYKLHTMYGMDFEDMIERWDNEFRNASNMNSLFEFMVSVSRTNNITIKTILDVWCEQEQSNHIATCAYCGELQLSENIFEFDCKWCFRYVGETQCLY